MISNIITFRQILILLNFVFSWGRKKLYYGLTSILSLTGSLECQGQDIRDKLQFSIGSSLLSTNFDWSIAGNKQGSSPNILSELKFRKINSVGLYSDIKYKLTKRIQIETYYQNNKIFSGTGTDFDYADDNRTNATYQTIFNSSMGSYQIFRIGAFFYLLHNNKIDLCSGIFYLQETQNFAISNTEFNKLKSSYLAKWKGPMIRLTAKYALDHRFSIVPGLSYSYIKYKAQADWNLIDLFKHPLSFEQSSNGRIIQAELGLNYRLNPIWALIASGQVINGKAFRGIDISYLNNNNLISTQFNGSNNQLLEFRLGAVLKLL